MIVARLQPPSVSCLLVFSFLSSPLFSYPLSSLLFSLLSFLLAAPRSLVLLFVLSFCFCFCFCFLFHTFPPCCSGCSVVQRHKHPSPLPSRSPSPSPDVLPTFHLSIHPQLLRGLRSSPCTLQPSPRVSDPSLSSLSSSHILSSLAPFAVCSIFVKVP